MHIEASHLSHSEYFRLNGALSAERTEQVLDVLASAESVKDCAGYVTDASAGYISEDFLHSQIKALQALAKNMRGANRQELSDIITRIEDAVLEEVRSAEYGMECLGKIREALS